MTIDGSAGKGGNSTFTANSTTYAANGGYRGSQGGWIYQNGTGGTASNGDLNIQGQHSRHTNGAGGASPFGGVGGDRQDYGNNDGGGNSSGGEETGMVPGGGGAGGGGSSADGGAGLVWIEW